MEARRGGIRFIEEGTLGEISCIVIRMGKADGAGAAKARANNAGAGAFREVSKWAGSGRSAVVPMSDSIGKLVAG